MTLREFYGHAWSETHAGPDGQVTTVTHEPRFDHYERETWIAKWEYERDLCPDCGNPRSVCADPNVNNYPQKTVCWVKAGQEVALRKWDKIIEKAKPDAVGYMPDDGVTIWVSQSDLTPDDDFLNPSLLGLQESPGEQDESPYEGD